MADWTIDAATAAASGHLSGANMSDSAGNNVSFGPPLPPGGVRIQFASVATAEHFVFTECPICRTAPPDTDEHVPAEVIGGWRMTKTCVRCNTVLGTALDPALNAWATETYTRVKVTSPGFRGHRFLKGLDVRETAAGEPVFIATPYSSRKASRTVLDEISAALSAGQPLDVALEPHNLRRVRLAGLKNAYLGACLILQEIPEGDAADRIRAALVAVREAPRGPLPECPEADRLELARSLLKPDGHRVALAAASPVGSAVPVPPWWISFAGVVATSWPFPDPPPFDESAKRS